MFIKETYIQQLLQNAQNVNSEAIDAILNKAERFEGLTHTDVAALLTTKDDTHWERIFAIAGKIKEHIYGNRIVMFAPLYISDYCINNCTYCSFHNTNQFKRRKLTMDEIREEVRILESMGHKRLAVEAGEDPQNCTIDYVIESLQTIYAMKFENGEIRRANVNIAATTVENYQKLKQAEIGTYILFQETYHQPTYKTVHKSGPKSSYEYHLTAFDRAMEGGIDDVGAGVLFGLYDPAFEVLGLLLHNEHLEKKFGVGFHTISVPRLCKAEGMDMSDYPHLVDDETFERIVAIIRLAVPFTGMILSTRENDVMRQKLMKIGISQISAGSRTQVGGYSSSEQNSQFEVNDERNAESIIGSLMDEGCIPSFCTACYRSGRTGDRFMRLAKTGQIKNVCLPNALMTLREYSIDYGDSVFSQKADALIEKNIDAIQSDKVRQLTIENLEKISQGQRDLFL